MDDHISPEVAFVKTEVAFVGQRIRQKICAALALSSVIPLLVLTYSLYAHVMPMLDPVRHARDLVSLQALIVFTGLLMAAGGFVIWDLATAVARAAQAVGSERHLERVVARTDEVGGLMTGFARMLATIERQAGQLNEYTARLEGAYRELELTNARLKEVSFRDEVTGLYNRRFFAVRLEEEVSRYRRFGHPLSVVLLDLDGFKAINDELGHAAGDLALRAVAEVLVRHSRGITVICRWGGDEFAVLLVETPRAGARAYAERMRGLLAGGAAGHVRPLTASFGVASLPEDLVAGAEDLVRGADEALYAAKRAGKNRVALYAAATAATEAPAEVGV
jgi:diguanylate cyclase (GGDEF)-like protein